MTDFAQACPQTPSEGVCPVAMVWVPIPENPPGMTAGQFWEMSPYLIGVLLTAKGFQLICRQLMARYGRRNV